MKVYVVTKGSYSDYHIEAIYDNKESAEFCAKAINGGGYDSAEVEEWELNSGKPKVYSWFCRINKKTGKVSECKKWDARLENSKGEDVVGDYYSMGETKEEAIKNASDYRAMMLGREHA